MSIDVRIIETGVANLASVRSALARCGARVSPATSAADVAEAEGVVLPGVGAFAPGMARLEELGLVDALRERIHAGRATLAVCLGMQLLARSSEESPGVAGLGVCDVRVERFPGTVSVPQLGWNFVDSSDAGDGVRAGYAYFANSFCVTRAPEGWRCAWGAHAIRFVAAMQRGGVLACQFHPELSGLWGRSLLQRWLGRVGEGVAC